MTPPARTPPGAPPPGRSPDDTPEPADLEAAFLVAAGAVAGGVASDLCPPLRRIRDALAVLVETLDQHFAAARGPEPYPWAETQALRERLAEAYLLSRAVTRQTADLARAVSIQRAAPEAVDLGGLVEQAVALSRHRVGEDCALTIDLGQMPAVRVVPGELVLLLARLLMDAADMARAGSGAPLVIRTRRERSDDGRDQVLVRIGAGEPGEAAIYRGPQVLLAHRVLEPAGGELRLMGPGLWELRLPLAR